MITRLFPIISETFILNQITGLLDLGHRVTVISELLTTTDQQPVQPDVQRYNLLANTHYVDMPPRRARLREVTTLLWSSLQASPWATLVALDPFRYGHLAVDLQNLFRLRAFLPDPEGYDVVHVHFGDVANLFRFAGRACGAGLVVSFHGWDFSYQPRLHGADYYRDLFAEVDVITVNSSFTGSKVRALGCPPDKIVRLPVGVDLRLFTFAPHPYDARSTVRLLTVARLVEKKGVEYSIRAVAKVRERIPHVRYDVVGDGPLRPRLQSLIEELGVSDIVRLHGARDSETVRSMMQKAHIFVLASVTAEDGDQEGQGLVLQEAQACGLPVVATNHGPFSESIVRGQSGLLVPERQPDALAECLLDLLSRPEAWPQMGRLGREFVESHFDVDILNRQLVEIYQRATYCRKRGSTRNL